jgi:hypothetical protein
MYGESTIASSIFLQTKMEKLSEGEVENGVRQTHNL